MSCIEISGGIHPPNHLACRYCLCGARKLESNSSGPDQELCAAGDRDPCAPPASPPSIGSGSAPRTIFEYLEQAPTKECEFYNDKRKKITGLKPIGAREFDEGARTPIVQRDETRGADLFEKRVLGPGPR